MAANDSQCQCIMIVSPRANLRSFRVVRQAAVPRASVRIECQEASWRPAEDVEPSNENRTSVGQHCETSWPKNLTGIPLLEP